MSNTAPLQYSDLDKPLIDYISKASSNWVATVDRQIFLSTCISSTGKDRDIRLSVDNKISLIKELAAIEQTTIDGLFWGVSVYSVALIYDPSANLCTLSQPLEICKHKSHKYDVLATEYPLRYFHSQTILEALLCSLDLKHVHQLGCLSTLLKYYGLRVSGNSGGATEAQYTVDLSLLAGG